MTTSTHNIDIRARSSGFRVIRRKIDDLGSAANNATRGIFLMQRALFVLGGAGAIRALSRQVDMLTNYENRLRLTATSAQNLEDVQRRLFQVARDSRSSFESVAEIYSRTALSVRELGISQQETIRFTESLAKATIISGASSREAHAALVQLGQGMASNTLRGDELRSVLEQLPFVADVIAESLGVTRGELRELGAEGKISAETILKAFREAEKDIDKLFANTIPTISQAISIANSNWLEFLDNLDDSTNASAKLAKAIIVISENIDLIIKSLAALAVAFASVFATNTIKLMVDYASSLKRVGVGIARLTELENLRATSDVRRIKASIAARAVRDVELAQRLKILAVQKVELQQEVLAAQFSVRNGLARNAATGQFVSLAVAKENLTRVTTRLEIIEGVEATTAARVVQVRGAQIGATNALTAANARLAAAGVASNTFTARLVRTFPIATGAVLALRAGFISLSAAMLANPVGLIVVGVTLAIAAFIRWGNLIKVTSDGVVGLKDAAVAAFQIIWEKITAVSQVFVTAMGGAIKSVTGFFGQFTDDVLVVFLYITEVVYEQFTAIPRFIASVIIGIKETMGLLIPAAKSIGVQVANGIVDGFEFMANGAIKGINKIIAGLNKLLSFVGATKALELFGFSGQLDEIGTTVLPRLVNNYEGAGQAASDAFTNGFNETMAATSFDNIGGLVGSALEPVIDTITDKARRNIDAAAEDLLFSQSLDNGQGGPTKPTKPTGGGSSDPTFNGLLAAMEREIELLGLSNAERKTQEGILKLEKELKRGLTEQEKSLAIEMLKSVEAAKVQASVLNSILGPREKAQEQIEALNALYAAGKLGIEDYTVALREMQAAADAAAGTLEGSFKAAISNAIMSAAELGNQLGNILVGAADSAADAIVEFARTGKFNIREFFGDLFAQITKLIAKQLILKALGFLFGFSGGGSILPTGPGFSTGGSILPTGPGSTDSQVVSFAKRPDERVDILTPGQQSAQRNNSQGETSSSGSIIVENNLAVAVVLDEKDIVTVLGGRAGDTFIVRGIERNSTSVKKVLG